MIYGGARGPLVAPALARGIVAVVAGGFCAFALILLIQAGAGPRATTLSIGYLAVLFYVQLFYFSQPRENRRTSVTCALLVVQACLIFLLLLRFGMPLDIASVAVGTVVAGLEVYGLTRLAGLIMELHAARTELASTAVAHERLRFARDLHDFLGLSLSAIVPKGELAHRLIAVNPGRAEQELTDILGISRRALADVRSVAHGYRDLNLDADDSGVRSTAEVRPTALLVRVLGISVLCGIFVKGLLYLAALPAGFAISAGALTVLLGIQLWNFTRPGSHSAVGLGLLGIQAVLVYLPVAVGVPPIGAGFLAGSALLALPPVAGVSAFTAIAASAGWIQARLTGAALDVVHISAEVVISGLVVYGLTWMARSVLELRAARIELAQLAVAEERLRFARDLHDLLGLSLSAITLKSELVCRVAAHCPERARAELTEIIDIARLALADVRRVACGYQSLSLQQELHTAESLLSAAAVDVRLSVRHGELSCPVGTLLATVLREGVTNVLRHSKAELCEITLHERDGMVCLEIVNDGVTQQPSPRIAGSGIDNLSYRVSRLGGTLTAGLRAEGGFRLRADVPA